MVEKTKHLREKALKPPTESQLGNFVSVSTIENLVSIPQQPFSSQTITFSSHSL